MERRLVLKQKFSKPTIQPKDLLTWEKVGETHRTYNERFKRTTFTTTYNVQHELQDVNNLWDVEQEIDNFYSNLVEQHLNEANDRDVITTEIRHDQLANPIFIPPQRRSTFNKEEFLNSIFQVSQSNSSFLLDGKLTLHFTIVKAFEGSGKRKAPETCEEFAKRKKSVVCIEQEDDNSCGYKTLFLGKYYADYGNSRQKEWIALKRDSRSLTYEGAMNLAREAGLNFDEPLSVDGLQIAQSYLTEYQLIVIDAKTRAQLFVGPAADKEIFLEYEDGEPGHFNLIVKVHRYFNRNHYCKRCNLGYNDRFLHNCRGGCKKCHGFPACSEDLEGFTCDICNITFNGRMCMQRHLAFNFCKRRQQCKQCLCTFVVRADRPHKCNKAYCRKCDKYYEVFPHNCFIRVRDEVKLKEEDTLPKIFVAFDVEAMQVEENGIIKHVPNLLISLTVCDECYDYNEKRKKSPSCKTCGIGFRTYWGANCIRSFCDTIYNETAKLAEEQNGCVYVFAHNSKGYDGHFILRDLFSRRFKQEPKTVLTGRKILKIEIGNVRFVDSLNFLLLPLAKLPGIFGLQDEKGFFPHHFNSPENLSYVGPVPSLSYYGLEYQKPDIAKKIESWHKDITTSGYTFNMVSELERYCKSDVIILMQSVLTFRNLFTSITGIDPYTRNFTLASVGLETFRAKLLQPETIGITPIEGYRESKNYSKSGAAYIDMVKKFSQPTLLREQRIGHYWVDGLVPQQKLVYEYLGCLWHGCPTCFTDRQALVCNQRSHQENHDRTMEKFQYLKSQGFRIKAVFECSFKDWLKHNLPQKQYYDSRLRYYYKIDHVGRLNIRDAFFGGRTNNIVFTHTAAPDETIEYYDFTSLYPTVLWESAFFLGHPQIIKEDFQTVDNYFGFVKCKILPPGNLHIPVLPVRLDGKLLFPLCGTCAKSKQQTSCNHSGRERCLIGTWTTMEVQEAVRQGYQVIETYEVNHYPRSDRNLFKEYIKLWLKIKQETSGWPSWVQNEQDKLQYIRQYQDKQGVLMDYDNIVKNPGLRWIAKIMLNSFWGKLAQRPNLPKTKICQEYADYWNILNDEKSELIGEVEVNPGIMMVTHRKKSEEDCSPGNTNIGIAAFVTAYARLKLFQEIQAIEKSREGRVLYFDTDSIIFSHRKGEYKPTLGDFLGEMTDEVSDGYGAGARIVKFASIGPKNYAYTVEQPDGSQKTTIKAKGIQLNAKTLDLIGMERITKMALEYVSGNQTELKVPQFQIHSDKMHDLYSRYFNKIYRAVSEKRRIIGNVTRPYGFIDNE